MNNKFFVPFNTARQLKEKGYPQSDAEYYYNMFDSAFGHIHERTKLEASYNEKFSIMLKYSLAAPTYHEVVDWLYEKKICITCHPAYSYEGQYNGFQYEMQTYDEEDYPDDIYRTREEALNAAILKALEMI